MCCGGVRWTQSEQNDFEDRWMPAGVEVEGMSQLLEQAVGKDGPANISDRVRC